MSDPVAWIMVERGWEVVDDGGEQVGTIDEVLGDPERDIFDGLAVSTGVVAKPRYVPAENVGAITVGHVALELSKADFERLDAHEPGPT